MVVDPKTGVPALPAPGMFQPLNNDDKPYAEVFRTISNNQRLYALFNSYYYGRHRLSFATEKFRNTFGRMFTEFSDNLCAAVIDAMCDRMRLTGFTGKNKDILEEVWDANKMDRRVGQMHLATFKFGDAYLLIWPDPITGEPVIYPQKTENMAVFYSDEDPDMISYAAKLWGCGGKKYRLNLYFADRIEKYYTPGDIQEGNAMSFDKFMPFQEEGDTTWPLPNKYGRVPVFHFINNSAFGEPGQSELRDTIAIQDALNKSVLDMMVAMEFAALPQRWATGIQVDIDETTGRPNGDNFTPGIDRIWAIRNEGAKLGEFQPADLGKFIEVSNSFRAEMARVSGTPPSYLLLDEGAKMISGDAMETAEARFLAKVRDRQDVLGETWEDVAKFCLQLKGIIDDDCEPIWKDPSPRSRKQDWEIAGLQAGIVSNEQILRELGYTEEQIADIQSESDAAAKKTASAGQAALNAFNSGMGPDTQDYGDSGDSGDSGGNPFGGK